MPAPQTPLALAPAEERTVRQGAHWAMGVGLYYLIFGPVVVEVLADPVGLGVSVMFGLASIVGGFRQRSPATRSARGFTVLIALYSLLCVSGMALALLVWTEQGALFGLLRLLLPLACLMMFVRARRVLRAHESAAALDALLPPSALQRDLAARD